MRPARSRLTFFVAACVALGARTTAPAAGTTDPRLAVSFAANRVSREDALSQCDSACPGLGTECSASYVAAAPDTIGKGSAAGHLTVTAPLSCLNRIKSALEKWDGPQPVRVLQIAFIAASKSESPGASPPPELETIVRDVRDILPFKTFRPICGANFRFASEGRMSSECGADGGDSYKISVHASAALDGRGYLVVPEFVVTRGDRRVFDTQLHLEFGRPFVLGAPQGSGLEGAIFVAAKVIEEPVPASVATGASAPSSAPAATPQLTRAFVLQGMQTRDAIGLLRASAQVRRIAGIGDLKIVVVRDDVSRVERCESLLREKNAVSRVVTTPEPGGAESIETRVFRLKGVGPQAVAPVLQSIYGMRDVKAAGSPDSVSATAPRDDLDAVNGLLRDLGILVGQP